MSSASVPPTRADWRAVAAGSFPWLGLLYFALYCAFGTESPFFPLFLAGRGLSAGTIGLMLAAGTLARLSTGPLVGLAADRFGARLVLALTVVGAGTIILLYLPAYGFWPLLVVLLLHAVAIAPLSPLCDALALNASVVEGNFRYGWVRGLGSASFILGTLASGVLVARFGLDSILVAAAVLFLVMLVPIPRLRAPPPAPARVARGGFRILLAIRAYRRLLVVAGLVIGSHAMGDTFAVIHWRGSGVGAQLAGLLWSGAVASEIVVFVLLGPWLLNRFGPARCAALSASAGILRWGVFATTPNVAAIGAAQVLHGFTFSLMHLVGMRIIAATVPAELSATAQTFYGTLSIGIATAAMTFVSGQAYGAMGAQAFWIMAALCGVALALVHRLDDGAPPPDVAPSRPYLSNVQTSTGAP